MKPGENFKLNQFQVFCHTFNILTSDFYTAKD